MIRAVLLSLGLVTLSACATARLHSVDEVNAVGQSCGVALGEVFQDEAEKKLLFLMKPGATAAQRGCVAQWARRNHMKFVVVDAISFPDEG